LCELLVGRFVFVPEIEGKACTYEFTADTTLSGLVSQVISHQRLVTPTGYVQPWCWSFEGLRVSPDRASRIVEKVIPPATEEAPVTGSARWFRRLRGADQWCERGNSLDVAPCASTARRQTAARPVDQAPVEPDA